MSVPNVTAGQPITEAWGDAVADSVNALEAADTAHSAAANPHPVYALDGDLTAAVAAHEAAANPHATYATDADLTAHGAAANPHPVYATDADLSAHAAAGHTAGLVHTINAVIDGGGAVISTGVKGDLVIDFACTITKWTLLADQSGSITVNLWRDSYANFPPTSGDVIGSPAIAGAAKAQSGAVSWAVAAGDTLRLNVASAATIQRCTVALTVVRT